MSDKPRTIRDGLVPLGPLDTYNGVPVSSFCETCRDGIARWEHGLEASWTLCPVDADKVAGNAVAQMDRAAPVSASVRYPAPWRVVDAILVDANGQKLAAPSDPFDGIEFVDAGVLALVEAAPELEALLRRVTAGFRDAIEDETRWDRIETELAYAGVRDAESLLARLDEARKAGG